MELKQSSSGTQGTALSPRNEAFPGFQAFYVPQKWHRMTKALSLSTLFVSPEELELSPCGIFLPPMKAIIF